MNKRINAAAVLLLSSSIAFAMKTIHLEEKPMLKAPSVQKYDDRNCIFDDSLNYLCLEHSIDLRVGWEIK
jgi:hypothetical protein